MATVTGAIRATDRVSDVLARDEALVEVFVRCSPHFAKLRNRTMRRTMARLVTVGQAARIADVPVTALLSDLNAALGLEGDACPDGGAADPGPDTGAELPPPGAPQVEVDVREDLRAGREPFSRIMAAVSALEPDAVLHLRSIFEPVPLFTVLGKRGFAHASRANGPGDWSVWFWRPARAPEMASIAGDMHALPSVPNTLALDVRGLEPPEPMVRTLTALETLPEGHTLLQVNVRVPLFLLPLLAERGYEYEIDESRPDRVFMWIRRAARTPDAGAAGEQHDAR